MKDNIIVRTTPNWFIETVDCISEYINNNYSIKETIENSKKFGFNKQEMSEFLDKIYKYKKAITDEIIPIFNNKYKELEPYFKDIGDDGSIINQYVHYYSDLLNSDITEQTVDKIFFSIVGGLREELLDIDEEDDDYDYSNLANIVNFLKISDLNDDEKMQIINFHVNRYRLTKIIVCLLEELSSICEKYFYIIEDEFNKSVQYVQNIDDFNETIKETVSIEYHLDWQVDVTVGIINFNQLGLRCRYKNTKVLIGMYVFQFSKLFKSNRFDDSHIVSDLKALGDVTRFRIIRMLSDKPMYLQELANNLKLTPATVSHHINILLQAEFLSIVVDLNSSKRICYELKTEKIEALSETLSMITKNDI